MTSVPALTAHEVRKVARGLWRCTIYPTLGIEVGHGKHMPCPFCGGRDRFRCDDQDGSGSWYCNQCEPHAGDGFALVMKVLGCNFPESLRRVAGVLRLDPSMPCRACPTPIPTPHNLVARAHRFEMGGLDLRLRADRIMEADRKVKVVTMTDADLDRAFDSIALTFADIERAELFEHVADTLRERDFVERMDREQSRRTA